MLQGWPSGCRQGELHSARLLPMGCCGMGKAMTLRGVLYRACCGPAGLKLLHVWHSEHSLPACTEYNWFVRMGYDRDNRCLVPGAGPLQP
jgi:hypothetical protein